MRHTLLPHAPDGTDEIAFERADDLALGLALAHAARDVVLRRGPAAQRGQGDAVEDGIKATVAAAVEAMAHAARRGGFQGSDTGVGGELGLALEATAGAEDTGESAGGEQADALEARQGGKARLGWRCARSR